MGWRFAPQAEIARRADQRLAKQMTPDAVHPRHTFQQGGNVFLDGKVQLCLGVALPDQP